MKGEAWLALGVDFVAIGWVKELLVGFSAADLREFEIRERALPRLRFRFQSLAQLQQLL